jgi:hypothetical protein
LEREARVSKVPVSAVLDAAVRDWLKKSARDASGEAVQHRLHAAAERCLGVLASGNPRRAETARQAVSERLRRRRAR